MLSFRYTRAETGNMTAALELPALEEVDITGFTHQGGVLHLGQLTGSCPNIRGLRVQLNIDLAQGKEADGPCCSLLNLGQLASLVMDIIVESLQANVDLYLPPSLTQLEFCGSGGKTVDFFWALREAVKCVGRGAQLHGLICDPAAAYLQPAQWDTSLEEQYRWLGSQLSSLQELEVSGAQEQLFSVVGAVASAAPSLVSLMVVVEHPLPRVEVSPICSASLEDIRVKWRRHHRPELPPPQVLLTLLPGCTRLREVVVDFMERPVEGAAVKIRCHCCSRRCIVTVGAYDVVVKFLHMPSSEQECTVLCSGHAAGPGHTSWWDHAVMPGIL